MKAVIMAGGLGTRLRAVTGELPKPMAPLLGRPLMEHIILLLKKHGFTDICAAVKYRAGDIESYFGDGGALGVRLCYRLEDKALGTAGAVRNCRDFYGDEDFLVISGDAACDLELGELMLLHREKGADVTMALRRESEPLRFGLAVTDSDGLIRSFVEKPDWSRVVTDLVNTGIYIISPRVMESVPVGVPCDFARELFPRLLAEGGRLYGAVMDGYWCDVGTPLSYYRCCADALEGRLRLEPGVGFAAAAEPEAARADDDEGSALDCPCRSRAGLMAALSEAFLELNADYSDGIRVHGANYELHISPLSDASAVRIRVSSDDAEFARSLALSAAEVARAFDL